MFNVSQTKTPTCPVLTHCRPQRLSSQMEFSIGQRVEYDGNRGTTLYVGEVPPTKGTWLGVEWDNPLRGKHSGHHEGTRYFSTKKPDAGSFVRINKIKPRSLFSEALSDRYLNYEGADDRLLNELKDEMNAPFLELVGLDKIGRQQSKLDEMKIVVLNQMCIYKGDENLHKICPNIKELDISANLFHTWILISEICMQLPHLAVLNISDNKLNIPLNPEDLKHAFKNLKQLFMSSMDYNWQEVMGCSLMWPAIENLAVPYNNISSIGLLPNEQFASLKNLNLEGNPIENWEDVNQLGHLPNLEQLSLYGTGLKNIQIKKNSFLKLSKLSLSNNRLSQWKHVSELDKLPKLTDLKICGNDDLKAESYDAYLQWIIARIANLKVLNGTIITHEIRRGAELDYLKFHGKEYLSVSRISDKEEGLIEFQRNHPRYDNLVSQYGPPEKNEMEHIPSTLKSTLIALQLVGNGKCIEKKLPATMTIQKLKTLCHRLFNIDSSELSLHSTSIENPDFCVPLDNDLRSISFYSLSSGDKIIVT